jgi:hypothetical protein
MKISDFKIGATGEFPYGKADESDEGALRMALSTDHRNGIIRIVFGKPISWLGLPSLEARGLAKMLMDKADELDKAKS